MDYKVSIMFHGLQYLIFIGAAAQILGAMNYIFRIFRGTVRPNRVSWLLWSSVPMISNAASLSAGVRSGSPACFCPAFVLLWYLSVPLSTENPSGSYKILIIFAEPHLFWLYYFRALTKQPIVAIVFSIVSDALASVPTIVKAWKYPATVLLDLFIWNIQFSDQLFSD